MGTPPEDRLDNIEQLLAELFAARYTADELATLLDETQLARTGGQLRLDKGAARAPRHTLAAREGVLQKAWDLREFTEKHVQRT